MIPSTMAQKNDAMTPILMNMIAAVSWREEECRGRETEARNDLKQTKKVPERLIRGTVWDYQLVFAIIWKHWTDFYIENGKSTKKDRHRSCKRNHIQFYHQMWCGTLEFAANINLLIYLFKRRVVTCSCILFYWVTNDYNKFTDSRHKHKNWEY